MNVLQVSFPDILICERKQTLDLSVPMGERYPFLDSVSKELGEEKHADLDRRRSYFLSKDELWKV